MDYVQAVIYSQNFKCGNIHYSVTLMVQTPTIIQPYKNNGNISMLSMYCHQYITEVRP